MTPQMTPRYVLAALGLLAGLAACTSAPPPTLYVLQAPTVAAPVKAPPAFSGKRLAVALGPVSVPDYLDRTDIVRRASGNRLDIAADERWAEPLRSGLQRLLIAAVAERLGPAYWVSAGSGRAGSIDVEVPVDIEAFEEDAAGQAVLTASWEVREGTKLTRDRRSYRRAVASERVEDRVRALSADAADLAADLAAAIARGR